MSDFVVRLRDGSNNVISTISFAGTTDTHTMTVTTPGVYRVTVQSVDNDNPPLMHRYYLTSVRNSAPILRAVDVLRTFMTRLIYVNATKNVTIKTTNAKGFRLFNTNPNNKFIFQSSPNRQTQASAGIATATFELPEGYYILYVKRDNNPSETIEFQSDIYDCPYSPLFSDRAQIFQPCVYENERLSHAQIAWNLCGSLNTYFYDGTCHQVDSECNTY